MVLFGAFAFISLTLFPRSSNKNWKDLPIGKKLRNAVFYVCGAGTVACLLWAVRQLWVEESVFWPEVGALEFVAVSWLVKGRTDWTALAVGKRTLHYGRHPGQLLDKVQHAIRR